MNRPTALLAVCLLAGSLPAASAQAVPRTMLQETFTNVSCPWCPENNQIVRQFLQACGPALAVGVQYHVDWPSATDPFYLLTPTEVDGRRTYYGVNGVPWNLCDGRTTASSSSGALEAALTDRLLTDSPFVLTVTPAVDLVDSTVSVNVKVDAVGTVPAGDLRLHVALIETEVHYASPPGSNGEVDFYNSLRRMLPDQEGSPLTLAQGQQQEFDLSTPLLAAWNADHVQAVVWVQQVATQEVLQAASSAPAPAYAFFFGTREAADVGDLGVDRSFASVVVNAGTSQDTYDFHITQDLPSGWSASVCAGRICYPPWTTDFALTVGAGVLDTVTVDITPLATVGSGIVTLTATSRGDPTKSWTRSFKLISSGLPILCVDADGGNNFETWYTAALDSTHHAYATWDPLAYGQLSVAQLRKFPIVVWNADLGYPPVSAEDRAALAAFLDSGGRLFISGQDIGWSLCDPSSPDYSSQTLTWYQTYLGATYLRDDTNILNISGVAGDPIGDGLSFSLSGGTGSGLQNYPSEIDPRPGASAIFTYSANREAGIRYQNGSSKVVYLAYGFQAQSTLASRTTVMDRILDWFDVDLVAVPDVPDVAPRLVQRPRAMPNPFSPTTRISFSVAGRGAVPVTVTVHDVLGRRVRTLCQGSFAPGERVLVWDGRDESGASARSGVYLARVRVGDDESSLKLFLAR